jgi:hypothetical protein
MVVLVSVTSVTSLFTSPPHSKSTKKDQTPAHNTLNATQASRQPRPSQHATNHGKESQIDHRATDTVAVKLSSGAPLEENHNKKLKPWCFGVLCMQFDL